MRLLTNRTSSQIDLFFFFWLGEEYNHLMELTRKSLPNLRKIIIYRVNGEFFTICKNVFIATHGLTAYRVRRIYFFLLNHQTPEDKRGKNISGNALPGDICVEIHQHINPI